MRVRQLIFSEYVFVIALAFLDTILAGPGRTGATSALRRVRRAAVMPGCHFVEPDPSAKCPCQGYFNKLTDSLTMNLFTWVFRNDCAWPSGANIEIVSLKIAFFGNARWTKRYLAGNENVQQLQGAHVRLRSHLFSLDQREIRHAALLKKKTRGTQCHEFF